MTAVISIAGGLLGGILFSKLAELAAVRIVGNHLGYKMTIEPKAIYYTVFLSWRFCSDPSQDADLYFQDKAGRYDEK